MLPGRFKRLVGEMEQIKFEIEKKKLNNIEILHMEEFKSVIFLCSGPLDSPYEGYWFRVKLEWSFDYPFRPPKCTFLDKIWNPYVDFESGKICMDILHHNFSPALTTFHIIISLISLLSESKISERNDGFLNPTAAIEMLKNRPYFDQHVRELCEKHSYKKKEIYSNNMRGIPQEHVIQVESDKIQQVISENIASKKFDKKTKTSQKKEIKEKIKVELNPNAMQIQVQQPAISNIVDSDQIAPSNNEENSISQQFNQSLSLSNQSNHLRQYFILYKNKKGISNQQSLTEDNFEEQVEKQRQKVKQNLQKFGTAHPRSKFN